MKFSHKTHKAPEPNAGSMADIAFLLLIFFLVTTTIMSDKGIMVKLPPWSDEEIIQNSHTRNVFRIAVNSENKLLVRGEEIQLSQLKEQVKIFILNPEHDLTLAAKPTHAVVSLINDRGTSYKTYLEVYNELKAAYNEIWEEKSRQQYGKSYASLSRENQQNIRADFPLVISESEPSDIAQVEY